MEGEASYSSFKLRCPHTSCLFSSPEYSQDELELHRELHQEGEHSDFSSESFRLDNTLVESPDMNLNLLNEINPLLSEAQLQSQLQNTTDEELQGVTYFVEEIFSEPQPQLAVGVAVAEYSVMPIPKLVEYSEANNYWHVKSGPTGNFSISFNFDSLPQFEEGTELQLKFELKRSHPSYEHVPVNVVCEKHLKGDLCYPIIASTLADTIKYTNHKEEDGMRKSFLLYKLGSLPVGSNQMSAGVSLRFPCYDTCVNTDFTDLLEKGKAGKVVMKEKSRFLKLVVTLEARQGDLTFEIPLSEEIRIPVWIKSAVAHRELKMTQRHKVKGGAALQSKMRKRSPPSSCVEEPDAKSLMTAARPELSDLVETFQPEQEKVWKSLQETFTEDQRNMLSIMSPW